MSNSHSGQTFKNLHQGDQPLLIPNPWDAGTAKLFHDLGFKALATTSLGLANSLGVRRPSREQVLDNCHEISEATPLPVNADLENCYHHEPEQAAQMLKDAWRCGVAGASIEDASGDQANPIYDFDLALERVCAAVEMVQSFDTPFVLTARAEDRLYGRMDLDETIRRLQAFEKAGADVLYAPGLRTLDEIKLVIDEVHKPINVVMGFADPSIRLSDLADLGVKRVSIGGAFSRLALARVMQDAKRMLAGDFGFVEELAPIQTLWDVFE